MGFWNMKCAVSDIGYISTYRRDDTPLNQVTLIYKSGRVVQGAADGYGNAGGVSYTIDFDDPQRPLMDRSSGEQLRLVLTALYTGQTFDELPINKMGGETQGFFIDDEEIDEWEHNLREEQLRQEDT